MNLRRGFPGWCSAWRSHWGGTRYCWRWWRRGRRRFSDASQKRRSMRTTLLRSVAKQPKQPSHREREHLFRVEDLVVALEQPGDCRTLQLHLGGADADGAVRDHAVALDARLGHLHPLDAGRRHRVEVDG